MELRLPFEAGMEWNQTPKDIPIPPGAIGGAIGLGVVVPGLAEQRRLEPPGGAKPKWARYGAPIPRTPGPRGQLPGTGAQSVGSGDGRFAFVPNPTGPDKQLPPGPDTETQSVKTGNDRSVFGLTSPTYPGPSRHRPDTGTQTVRPASDRFAFGIPTPTYPRSEGRLPGVGTPPRLGRFGDGLADMTDMGSPGGLPGGAK